MGKNENIFENPKIEIIYGVINVSAISARVEKGESNDGMMTAS